MIIESKEALQLAGNLLLKVSKDERERAIFRSRRMFRSDQESNIATAVERGKRDGEIAKAFAVARNMIANGEPLEKIARYTGLTINDIKNYNFISTPRAWTMMFDTLTSENIGLEWEPRHQLGKISPDRRK